MISWNIIPGNVKQLSYPGDPSNDLTLECPVMTLPWVVNNDLTLEWQLMVLPWCDGVLPKDFHSWGFLLTIAFMQEKHQKTYCNFFLFFSVILSQLKLFKLGGSV